MTKNEKLRQALLVMFSLPYDSVERTAAAHMIRASFDFGAIIRSASDLEEEGLIWDIIPGQVVEKSGRPTEIGQVVVNELLRLDQEEYDAEMAAMVDGEPKAEAQLPQMYMLQLNRQELDYLSIGAIANAASITANKQFAMVHWASLTRWASDVQRRGENPIELNNGLTERIAKLLGAPFCENCQCYHTQGGHT